MSNKGDVRTSGREGRWAPCSLSQVYRADHRVGLRPLLFNSKRSIQGPGDFGVRHRPDLFI